MFQLTYFSSPKEINGFNIPVDPTICEAIPAKYNFLNKILAGDPVKNNSKIYRKITIARNTFKAINYGVGIKDIFLWILQSLSQDLTNKFLR